MDTYFDGNKRRGLNPFIKRSPSVWGNVSTRILYHVAHRQTNTNGSKQNLWTHGPVPSVYVIKMCLGMN